MKSTQIINNDIPEMKTMKPINLNLRVHSI